MSLHGSLIFFSHITIIPDDIRRMALVSVYANCSKFKQMESKPTVNESLHIAQMSFHMVYHIYHLYSILSTLDSMHG